MSERVRIFVNGSGIDVPVGATALDAVRLHDPDAAGAIARGERAVADSRGLALAPDSLVYHGAIYRIVRAAER